MSAGVVLIVMIRSRLRQTDTEHISWETTLAEYKNLRDKGVLSAEEYRKIRTLVEPRVESAGSLVAEDQGPASRRCG